MTTSRDLEDRVESRLGLEATIFVEILASDSHNAGNVLMCNSLDLSEHGLQVVVDDEMPAGSIFRLCIDLKDSEPIFLVAEVKWQRPDPDADAFRIGFLLFESDDTDIQRWRELVADMLAVE
ncbi:MAG: PilZ domain-containing protein [Gammaproteobacteria bacterium]|nr:PilZ domain-containing protein [Gammaproteobacteria bacterium]